MDLALIQLALCLIALPPLCACGYLFLLSLLSARPAPPPHPARRLCFDVIVPAHDEAPVIERTVNSLHALNWPAARFRVRVVADNCSDATAALARAAGAQVWERRDPQRRGKGYALEFAFAKSRAEGWADACAVVDADSEVLPNLLESFAARLECGASAVQARYRVLNPQASWRTRLLAIAKAAFHDLRSRARERLRLSCGLRGNGWCVSHDLLRKVPYAAFSLAEDLEFGIELGLAGVRVAYADEAEVRGEMVVAERAARSQRRRWEDGRRALRRSRALVLLRAALRRRSRVCLDLALDLLVPPLATLALEVLALAGAAGVASMVHAQLRGWLWLALASAAALALHVLRGWQLSGVGARGLLDLGRAPFYMLWKLSLRLRRSSGSAWLRTEREAR